MGDVNESEEEDELEQSIENKKKNYINQTRELTSKPKKVKTDDLEEEETSEEDSEDEKSVEKEDDFARQLRLEKEELERKEKAGAAEEKKKKNDPDGTEYEWDPQIKGWFPKVN